MSKEIKNIVFDFGGVIINIDFQNAINEFVRLGISNFDEYYSKFTQNKLFEDLERGNISPEDFRKILKESFDKPVSDEQINNAWNALLLDIPPHRIKLLEEVKKNYRIFLLSNSNIIHYDDYVEVLRNNFGYNDFSDLFEEACFSFNVGMIKPDKDIFEYLIKNNNIKAAETLFIDDFPQHVETAKSLGLNTYRLNAEEGEDVSELFNNGKLKI